MSSNNRNKNFDYSQPEPMTEEQIRQMRSLIADEAYSGAHHKSIDYCAMYVRQAIERAHKKITNRELHVRQTDCAKDYGPGLINSGFRVINEPLQKGDIAIYQVTRTSPWGHIQVFTGSGWVSDYRQNSMHPDSTYKTMVPVYYRFYGTNI